MIATVLTVAAVTLGGVAARDARPVADPAAPTAAAPPAPVARSLRVALSQVGAAGAVHVPAARSRRFHLDPAGGPPRPAVATPAQVRPDVLPPVSGPTGPGGAAVGAAAPWRPWLAGRPFAGPRGRPPPGTPARAPATRPG